MTTNEHFQTFVQWCEEYRKYWGLFGWKVFYDHSEDLGCYANTTIVLRDRTLRVQLNKDWPEDERPVTEIELRNTARHEMIHAMLARIDALSYTRWAGRDEIDEAVEEAVRLIENVLDLEPATGIIRGEIKP